MKESDWLEGDEDYEDWFDAEAWDDPQDSWADYNWDTVGGEPGAWPNADDWPSPEPVEYERIERDYS